MTHASRTDVPLRAAARQAEKDAVAALCRAAANWRDVGNEPRAVACEHAVVAVHVALAGLPTGGGRA